MNGVGKMIGGVVPKCKAALTRSIDEKLCSLCDPERFALGTHPLVYVIKYHRYVAGFGLPVCVIWSICRGEVLFAVGFIVLCKFVNFVWAPALWIVTLLLMRLLKHSGATMGRVWVAVWNLLYASVFGIGCVGTLILVFKVWGTTVDLFSVLCLYVALSWSLLSFSAYCQRASCSVVANSVLIYVDLTLLGFAFSVVNLYANGILYDACFCVSLFLLIAIAVNVTCVKDQYEEFCAGGRWQNAGSSGEDESSRDDS